MSAHEMGALDRQRMTQVLPYAGSDTLMHDGDHPPSFQTSFPATRVYFVFAFNDAVYNHNLLIAQICNRTEHQYGSAGLALRNPGGKEAAPGRALVCRNQRLPGGCLWRAGG